ncbi:MAG: hypothetical protein GF400_00560 [Candidatus Eisenbacteria bacterium]|nr:hypothetical protein [Candidatus Eisenbacteria bacterium]
MRRSLWTTLLWTAVLLALLIATAASGETWTVDARGGEDVFRYIDQAVAWAADGDTLLILPGVYSGFRNRDIDLNGLDLVIRSAAGPESTIVDCEGEGRSFHIQGGVGPSCVIEGLTIRNGEEVTGGGMLIEGSSPTLEDLVFRENAAYQTCGTDGGAAIYCDSGASPVIRGCVFISNTAYRGGGVYCRDGSDPVITECTFADNAGDYFAAGIFCFDSSPTVERCVIAHSNTGGPITCAEASNPTVVRCVFFGNPYGDEPCGSASDMLFADPLFCDFEEGDVSVCDDSPCLPANNPFGVLIGARGASDCPCPPVTGRTLRVPGEYATIEDALAEAVARDTVLVSAGTYPERRLRIPWGVALVGIAGPDSTVIDGGGNGSGTGVIMGYDAERADGLPPARLEGLTVTGFAASGIKVRNCSPVIRDCVVSRNDCWSGAGLRCERRGSPHVSDVRFIENTTPGEGYGGAVVCHAGSSPVFEGVVFWRNYAKRGGAVHCMEGSEVLMTDCTVAGSIAQQGALFLAEGSSLVLRNSVVAFTDGTRAFSGHESADASIEHCVVYANSGGDSLPGEHSENIFEDPLFCSLSEGLLTPRLDSPCLPENNPYGLLIGALDYEECDAPPCRVLRVPDEYATIGAAVEEAAHCDTVLVSPGVYNETEINVPHGVTLRSTDGPLLTTIDAGGESTPVLFGHTGPPTRPTAASVLEGFTITGGDLSGIRIRNADPQIHNCVIEGNRGVYGGGIQNKGGSPIITSCVIRDNAAPEYYYGDCGGGLYAEGSGTSRLEGVVLLGNLSERGGAVLCEEGHEVIVKGCTLADNEATWGSGLTVGGSATIEQSIIAFSGTGEAVRCLNGSEVSVTHSCVFATGWSDSLCGEHAANLFENPGFCDLEGDHLKLCVDSPCLPENNPHGLLIGAEGAGGCDCPETTCRTLRVPSGYATIEEALAEAARCDTVLVESGTYHERELFLPWGVKLLSEAGADSTVIDADGEGTIVHAGSEEAARPERFTTVVGGFTFTGASESAIRIINGNPLIRDCVFASNEAHDGGGIYCLGACPGLVDLSFSGNHVTGSGGGLFLKGSSDAALEGVTFDDNSAAQGGGAIHCRSSSPTLDACVFTGNSSEEGGAVRCWVESSPTISGCVFSQNEASYRGGAVRCEASSPVVERTTFHDNAAPMGGAVNCSAGSSPTFSECTFAANAGDHGSAACIAASDNSLPVVEYSVIAFCSYGMEYSSSGGGYVTTHHSIAFGNVDGDSLGGAHHDNLFTNPLFCDLAAGNLRVDVNSPCLPDHNPWGEQVGAWGAGCSGTGIDEPDEEPGVATSLALACAPNPVGGETELVFTLPEPSREMILSIYRLDGRLVRTVLRGPSPSGRSRVSWDGTDGAGRRVSSGVYFARLATEHGAAEAKLVLLR